MKALVYEGPREMNIREVEQPTAGSGEVLIEVVYSGICGSELSGFLGQSSLRKPPCVFGHEFAGKIVEIGPDVSPELGLAAGDRVTANPLVTCGTCRYCRAGQEQLCTSRQLLGAALPGSNARYVKVPARSIFPLPETLSYEQATLAEPIAYAVHVANLADIQAEHRIAIHGMGPIGLFVLQVSRHRGARQVLVVDTNDERLAIAEALGAGEVLNPTQVDAVQLIREHTDGLGADIVVDAVGSSVTRANAVLSARMGGTVVWSGLHSAETSLPINDMIRQEIRTLGAFAYSAREFGQALDLLAQGAVGLRDEWMVKSPLADGALWFDRLLGNPGGVAKVLLTP